MSKNKNDAKKKDSFIVRIIKSDFFIYIIFGVVATVVNMVAFRLFNSTLPFDKLLTQNISYVLAWIISFFVAFFCNKFFVFKSKSMKPAVFWKEFGGFFAARILSLFVHIGIANLCVLAGLTGDVIIGTMVFAKLLDDISNLIGNIAEVILNYICSKLFIFKNKKSGEVPEQGNKE